MASAITLAPSTPRPFDARFKLVITLISKRGYLNGMECARGSVSKERTYTHLGRNAANRMAPTAPNCLPARSAAMEEVSTVTLLKANLNTASL
jgi:hypothetical protein